MEDIPLDWFPNSKQLDEIRSGIYAQDSTSEVLDKMKSGDAYDLTEGKGLCVLMNQSNDRLGSEFDVQCISELMEKQLNMKVKMIEDCRADTLKEKLDKYFNSKKMLHYNCIVLILMAHGNGDSLKMMNGTKVDLQEDILCKMGNWLAMRGKPKVVLVQACEASRKYKDFGFCKDSGIEMDTVELDNVSSQSPKMADVLLVRATHMAIASYRHTAYGTLFIQAWCEVVKRFAHQLDLQSMFNLVRRLMGGVKIDESFQICRDYYGTFTRNFYFRSTCSGNQGKFRNFFLDFGKNALKIFREGHKHEDRRKLEEENGNLRLEDRKLFEKNLIVEKKKKPAEERIALMQREKNVEERERRVEERERRVEERERRVEEREGFERARDTLVETCNSEYCKDVIKYGVQCIGDMKSYSLVSEKVGQSEYGDLFEKKGMKTMNLKGLSEAWPQTFGHITEALIELMDLFIRKMVKYEMLLKTHKLAKTDEYTLEWLHFDKKYPGVHKKNNFLESLAKKIPKAARFLTYLIQLWQHCKYSDKKHGPVNSPNHTYKDDVILLEYQDEKTRRLKSFFTHESNTGLPQRAPYLLSVRLDDMPNFASLQPSEYLQTCLKRLQCQDLGRVEGSTKEVFSTSSNSWVNITGRGLRHTIKNYTRAEFELGNNGDNLAIPSSLSGQIRLTSSSAEVKNDTDGPSPKPKLRNNLSLWRRLQRWLGKKLGKRRAGKHRVTINDQLNQEHSS